MIESDAQSDNLLMSPCLRLQLLQANQLGPLLWSILKDQISNSWDVLVNYRRE